MNKNKLFLLLIMTLFITSLVSCKKKTECEKNGHQYANITCEDDTKCLACGYVSSKATGHNEIIDEAVNPTCTLTGLTEGSHCNTCNKILVEQQSVPALGHEYGDWSVVNNPTETTSGLKQRTCSLCNYVDSITLTYNEVLEYIISVSNKVTIQQQTKEDITIPTQIDDISITWKSSNLNVLSTTGKVLSRSAIDKKVSLYATYYYLGVSHEIVYDVTILGYDDLEKIELASEKVIIPDVATGNLEFKTSLAYKVKVIYTSSNPEVLSNEGQISPQKEDVRVAITVLFTLGDTTMEKSYEVLVKKYSPEEKMHQLTIYSKDLNLDSDSNIILVNDRFELKEGICEATYYSQEYETMGFEVLVGSWAAISSEFATCELKVSLKVDNTWSDYISYSAWGLGLQNELHDQENDLIKLSVDEVMVKNNKLATGIRYSITLRRTDESKESSKLSLVSFALQADNHSHYIDKNDLSNYVLYNVPQLNQNIVPNIGNIICSATSTTMLLNYYGFDFSDKDAEYEHRYIASLVKDYGNNIYGNWVYNTAVIGAYGLNAYLARMYSLEELMYHLSKVGPVALTVKGTMTSNVASYTTGGHLIVCVGYKYDDGNLVFICNDPNVKEVRCEYSKEVMENTWRKVAYVIEKPKTV